MITTPRALCDCGTTRRVTDKGFAVCDHCDGGCTTNRCDTCAKFSAAVSRRITQ